MRAGRDDHAVGAVPQDLAGRHLADPYMDFDILSELFQLRLPVRDDATPFAQSRQRRDRLPVAAELLFASRKCTV